MTHEFAQVLSAFRSALEKGRSTVLATIVHVEGSSYRKEGTRMLIDSEGTMTGALSGGCVEKEVLRQAQAVFTEGKSRVFKYDGRYRLGCEGSIYILIEPFAPNEDLLAACESALQNRRSFTMRCAFSTEEGNATNYGTSFHFQGSNFLFPGKDDDPSLNYFEMRMEALNRLCIFGVEHDARTLSQLAHFLGWDVVILASEQSSVTSTDFPLASKVLAVRPEDLDPNLFAGNTAVVVMSHSYSKDLHFMMHLVNQDVPYIGLLGPVHRRERLLDELMEREIYIDAKVFDRIHGPVGLPIGSVTPEEIALSIMAEITTVFRKESVPQLSCSKP